MEEFFKTKYNLILYFIITVVFFGSIGVWLPFIFDWFNENKDATSVISKATLEATPNNIVTYFLSVFTIALIDRILFIIDEKDYNHRKTEILISLIIIFIVFYFVLCTFKQIKFANFSLALIYSIIGAIISFIIWWIANYKETKTDPFNSVGGNADKPLTN